MSNHDKYGLKIYGFAIKAKMLFKYKKCYYFVNSNNVVISDNKKDIVDYLKQLEKGGHVDDYSKIVNGIVILKDCVDIHNTMSYYVHKSRMMFSILCVICPLQRGVDASKDWFDEWHKVNKKLCKVPSINDIKKRKILNKRYEQQKNVRFGKIIDNIISIDIERR